MKKPFLIFFGLLFFTANFATAGTFNVGYETIGSAQTSEVNNVLYVARDTVDITASDSGTALKIYWHVPAIAVNDPVDLAVYTIGTTGASRLTDHYDATPTSSGWHSVDISAEALSITEDETYAVGIRSCDGPISIDYDATNGGNGYNSSVSCASSLPSTLPTMSQGNARISAYIEVQGATTTIDETGDHMADGRIIQVDSSDEGSIALSGTYSNGTPSAIEVQVFNRTTSAIVQINSSDWTTIDSSPAGGTWSGTLSNIPKTNAWLGFKARFTGDSVSEVTSTNKIGVGWIVACLGQSHIAYWFSTGGETAHDLTRRYSGSAWNTNDGYGAVRFANNLQAALECPIALLQTAAPGSALLEANEGGTFGWWIDTDNGFDGTRNKYGTFQATLTYETLSRREFGAVLWVQGYQDATQAESATDYVTKARLLFTQIRTDANHASIPIFISGMPHIGDTTPTDANTQNIRDAHLTLSTDSNNYWGCTTVDIPLVDTVHLTSAGQQTHADRLSQSVLHHILNSGNYTYSRGPRATLLTVINDTTADITILHDGGTDFTPTSGIDSFEVYTGSWISATGARQDATTVRLTHASGSVTSARCLYGQADTIANILKDNTGKTLPLETNNEISADGTNPVCTITNPTTDETDTAGWTISGNILSNDGNIGSIDVSGAASDNIGLNNVTWACPTCTPTSGTASGTTTWSISGIGLADGDNVITVTANDLAANTHDDVLTVTYDEVVSYSLPTGWGLGDVGKFYYQVTARDTGGGKAFVEGCFPTTQLINRVGSYCLELEVDNVASGPQLTTDNTSGWNGSINTNQVFLKMSQDN